MLSEATQSQGDGRERTAALQLKAPRTPPARVTMCRARSRGRRRKAGSSGGPTRGTSWGTWSPGSFQGGMGARGRERQTDGTGQRRATGPGRGSPRHLLWERPQRVRPARRFPRTRGTTNCSAGSGETREKGNQLRTDATPTMRGQRPRRQSPKGKPSARNPATPRSAFPRKQLCHLRPGRGRGTGGCAQLSNLSPKNSPSGFISSNNIKNKEPETSLVKNPAISRLSMRQAALVAPLQEKGW